MAPPPALKARIMAEVEREASLLAAAGPEADRPPAPARRRFRLPSLRIPRLVPAAVAAALLVVGVGDRRRRDAAGAGPDRTIQAQVQTTRTGSARTRSSRSTAATARLVARGLPAPPTGRVYQVWLKRAGQAPEPTAALFKPSRDGTATASVPGSLDDVDQVMVTDEPDGGSTHAHGRAAARREALLTLETAVRNGC